MPLAGLFNDLAGQLQGVKFRELRRYRNRPDKIQGTILRRILRKNKDTQFGREHGFSGIRTLSDYQQAVPIRTHSEYAGYLGRVYQGARNVLTREAPFFFAMTAGSTGDFKYIPLTRSLKRELDRSVMTFYHLLANECPAVRGGKIQFLVGSAEGGRSPGGVPQGFVSGYNYKSLPRPIRERFVVPYSAFTIEDADDRYYAMARFLLPERRLTAIGALTPLNLINLGRAIESGAERLVRDVRDGTLSLARAPAPPGLVAPLRPDPERARELELVASRHGEIRAGGAFPALGHLVCWMGGNMSYFLPELFSVIGRADLFEMPLSASEGIFALPHRVNKAGGLAAVTGHFLEFMPEREAGSEHPRTATVGQLEEGGYYYLVITTSGGLYRYDMEDLVLVSGFWHGIPILEFVSKRARQASIANERINERDVTVAMAEVSRRFNRYFSNFLFLPCRDRRYRVLIDGADLADQEPYADLLAFSDALEQEMRQIAKGYDFEREDLLLEPLELCVTSPSGLGEYIRSRQFRSALPSAQFKPLHLTNDFDGHLQFTLTAAYPAGGSR